MALLAIVDIRADVLDLALCCVRSDKCCIVGYTSAQKICCYSSIHIQIVIDFVIDFVILCGYGSLIVCVSWCVCLLWVVSCSDCVLTEPPSGLAAAPGGMASDYTEVPLGSLDIAAADSLSLSPHPGQFRTLLYILHDAPACV